MTPDQIKELTKLQARIDFLNKHKQELKTAVFYDNGSPRSEDKDKGYDQANLYMKFGSHTTIDINKKLLSSETFYFLYIENLDIELKELTEKRESLIIVDKNADPLDIGHS